MHQGRGIGHWCLEQVDLECRRDGATAVRCDVLQANVPLRRFYERHGYEARGERFILGGTSRCMSGCWLRREGEGWGTANALPRITRITERMNTDTALGGS